MAARSSKLSALQPGAAAIAVSIASETSVLVASCIVTQDSEPAMRRGDVDGFATSDRTAGAERHRQTQACSPDISFKRSSSRARSALPGAKCSGGSLMGLGTVVTASIASTPGGRCRLGCVTGWTEAGLRPRSILARSDPRSPAQPSRSMQRNPLSAAGSRSLARHTTATRGPRALRSRTAHRRRQGRRRRPGPRGRHVGCRARIVDVSGHDLVEVHSVE